MDFISKFIEEQANLSKQFDVASAKSVSEFDILHNTFCSFEKDINDFNDINTEVVSSIDEFSHALYNVFKNIKHLLSFAKVKPPRVYPKLEFEDSDDTEYSVDDLCTSMTCIESEMNLIESFVKKYILCTINKRITEFINPFIKKDFPYIHRTLLERENKQKIFQFHRSEFAAEQRREDVRDNERKELEMTLNNDAKNLGELSNLLIQKFKEMKRYSNTYWKIEIPLLILYLYRFIWSYRVHTEKTIDNFGLDLDRIEKIVESNMLQRKFVDSKLPLYSDRFKLYYSSLLFHEYNPPIYEIDLLDKPLERPLFPLQYNPVVQKAVALFDCESDGENELSFKKGDVMVIHEEIEEGWVVGDLRGLIGKIPKNYIAYL